MRSLLVSIGCLMLSSTISYATITGTAFKDYNADGIKQSGEPVVGGVIVKAYDVKDSFIAQTTTLNDGNYTLDIDKYPVRLEFELPTNCMIKSDKDFPSAGATKYGSSIQFVNGNNEIHNFAISYPYDFSINENPDVYTSILINGDPLADGTTAQKASIVKFKFKDSKLAVNGGRELAQESNAFNRTQDETGPAWIEIAKQYQTGSVYGLAYSREANRLFAAAFLKRHTGFGPLGSGGIYILNPNKTPEEQENINFLNLDKIGIATSNKVDKYSPIIINGDDDDDSNDLVEFSAVIGSNKDRGLLADVDTRSNDPLAYGQVGKLGLGDLDISEDGRFLYVVNLYDRKLYQIDLSNAKNPVAPTIENKDEKIKSFDIPNICTYSPKAGEYRPFGLKISKGKAYVGIVCSGEDAKGYVVADSTSDMKGAIYSLNLSTGMWSEDPQVEWTFDYRDSDGSQRPWHIWLNSWAGNKEYSVPIISDIEFDNNGDLLIGIKDIHSDVMGSGNYAITGTHIYSAVSAGDLIKATRVEDEQECSYEIDLAKEFYHDGLIHPESTGGALAGHHTSITDSVLSTFEDPVLTTKTKVFGYGVHLYDNKTGKRVNDKLGYEVIFRKKNKMGKANAIGDIETMEVVPPIEIGNRVWLDKNRDGIQNAGEPGIKGVKLLLSQGSDCSNIIAKTTTNNNGEYIFNHTNVNSNSTNLGLRANSDYTICIDKSQFNNSKGVNNTPLRNLSLTINNANSNSDNPQKVDSDAVVGNNGNAYIAVRTKNAGENTHSYDIGFIKSYCIETRVWDDNNSDGILDNNENNFSKEVTIELVDNKGNSVVDIYNNEVNPIYTTDGNYKFCNLDKGKYRVKFTIPNGYGFSAKNTTGHSLIDSDVNLDTNATDVILLDNGDYSVNAGVIKLATLGNFVWNDKNKNGIQDSTEKGVSGVKIELYKDGTNIKSTYTDENGYYKFTNLTPDKYKIKVQLPKGYKSFSLANKDSDNKDSDIEETKTQDDIIVGYSSSIKLKAGQNYKDLDVGLICACKPAIDIEKYTQDNNKTLHNAESINDSDVPEFIIGQSVKWVYKIRNIGNVTLNNIKVLDDKEGAVTCPKSTLKAKEEMICIKNGIVSAKTYENNATVRAQFEDTTITDSDLSHYKAKNSVCIGDFIWEDSNENGIFDNNEKAIKDAKVELFFKDGTNALDYNNNKIKAQISNTKGIYKFCNLDPNKSYFVKLTPIDKYTLTQKGKDSAFNTDYTSDIISFNNDENNLKIDAGLYKKTYCLGDFVWNDINKNGIQDNNEKGVAGIKVILNEDNTKTAITNKNGFYQICNLENGKYSVTFDKKTLPKGYVITTKNSGEKDKDSNADKNGISDIVTIKDANNTTLDMGIYKVVAAIDIEKYTNNIDADNQKEAYIAQPYESITWKYIITNIGSEPLKNIVVEDDKEGHISCPKKSLDINESMVCLKKSKAIKLVYENRATVTAIGTLSQEKTLDSDLSNYKINTKPNVKIEKYTNNIDADKKRGPFINKGDIVTWKYVVTNIGNEKLVDIKVVDDKEVNIICPKKSLDINESMECKKVNFALVGEYENNGTVFAKGEISNKSITDSDLSHYFGVDAKIDIEKFTNNMQADNINDNMPVVVAGKKITWKYVVTNRGNIELKNIKVIDDKEGLINCPKDKLDVNESMECIKEGVAIVKENAKESIYTNIATVTAKTPTNQDVNDTDSSSYKGIKTACLGNFVWEDKNANGIQDKNEKGLAGFKIELFDIKNNLIATKTTDENGKYKFCNLMPDSYYIKVEPKNGYYFSKKDATIDSKDSDIIKETNKSNIIKLSSAEDNETLDVGLFKPACIGDKIWLDSNANGIQDANENGVAGIKVSLYKNNKEITRDIDNNIFLSKTDKNGSYKFCKLIPGEYQVRVTIPKGYYVTRKNTTIDSKDSDMGEFLDTNKIVNMPKETLVSEENNTTFDGGIFKSVCLGDYVWLDTNINGIQDKDEQPLEGIEVKLIPIKDSYGYINTVDIHNQIIKDKIIKTDNSGHYEYCNLIPGTYKVAFKSEDKEYISTKKEEIYKEKNSDIDEFKNANRTWLETNDINLTSNSNIDDAETLDAGFTQEICLGDKVWLDENVDGIQDSNTEYGVQNIKVELYDENNTLLKSMTTDKNGNYKFCELKPLKDYKIKVVLPKTYNTTLQNVGSDTKDSDANKNGWIYVKQPTKDNISLDIGIHCDCTDWQKNSKEQKLSASFNIFPALASIFILIILSLKMTKKQKEI